MNITMDELAELLRRRESGPTCGGEPQSTPTHPIQVGRAVFIRTVTHHHVGRVKGLVNLSGVAFVELTDCAWIADDGRFSEALASGSCNEVEPFPAGSVLIGLGSIVDAAVWSGTIPLVKK